MIKNLREKIEKITSFPRPKKETVSKILKEVYKQGVEDGKRSQGIRVKKL